MIPLNTMDNIVWSVGNSMHAYGYVCVRKSLLKLQWNPSKADNLEPHI